MDVVKLAMQRRDRLRAEIQQLNSFIAIGEQLAREENSPRPAPIEGHNVKPIEPRAVHTG